MWKIGSLGLIALLFTACFKTAVISQATVKSGSVSHLAKEIAPGKSVAVASATSTEVLNVTVSDTSVLAGTNVSIAPGSLAVSTNIIIEQSADLVDTSMLTEMPLQTDVSITQAGKGVIVRPSEPVELSRPLQLSLPLPVSGGLRLAGASYAVYYKQFDPQTKELTSGVKPVDNVSVKIVFDNASQKDQVSLEGYFGAYWVVALSRAMTQAETPPAKPSVEPITNINNTAVISQAGIVKETTVVSVQAIPEISWDMPVVAFENSNRKAKLTIPSIPKSVLKSCKAEITEHNGDLNTTSADLDVPSAAVIAIVKLTPHQIKGRFRCIDANSKSTFSAWSLPVAVEAYRAVNVDKISASSGNGFYSLGASVQIVVGFSGPVTVEGTPTLLLETGADDRTATYVSGSGTSNLSFSYLVEAGDVSADLTVKSTAIDLTRAKITDANGIVINPSLPAAPSSLALEGQSDIVIDTVSPQAPTAISFASNTSVSTTFPATWSGGSDLHFKQFNSKICQQNDCATSCSSELMSTASSNSFTGTLGQSYFACVQAEDYAGNKSPWISSSTSIALSNPGPAVVSVTSAAGNGYYKPGDNLSITVQFAETVVVTNASDISLGLETGSIDRSAVYTSGSGTNTLVFTYSVQANDISSDLEVSSTSALTLGSSGTIRNGAGVDANLTLPILGSASSLSGQKAFVIDGSLPTNPSAVGFADTHTSSSTFSLAWSNSTDANFSTHNIKLCTSNDCATGCGSQNQSASSPVSMTGSNGMAYYGCVQGQDVTGQMSAWVSSLQTITVDMLAPTINRIYSSNTGFYPLGAEILISVEFSEPVYVTGGPQRLQLETGATDHYATYQSGSGSNTLVFHYSVQAGDTTSDLEVLSQASFDLVSGTVRDVAGNNATLTCPTIGGPNSLAQQSSITLDTVAPTVNAGTDATAVTSIILSATATDANTIMTYSWTKISGPSTVTFSNANVEDPTATFAASGTYVLRLTVTDPAGNSASDNVQIISDSVGPTFEGITELFEKSNSEVMVFWKPATDNVSPSHEIVYELCYSTSVGSCDSTFIIMQTINPQTWQASVTGLSPGVNHEFVVRARDQSGNATIGAKKRVNGPVLNASQINTRKNHSCAVKTDQTVECWGNNEYGQLGDGTYTYRTHPVQVPGLTSVLSVATSDYHSCALRSDQTVLCWGYGARGELGHGSNAASLTPVSVGGLTTVQSIAVGAYHSCALLSDQTVSCWGFNSSGQLGDGTTTNRSTATTVPSLTGVQKIAAGERHSCAILTDQTAKCWGANTYGQLGDGTTTSSLSPVVVAGLTGANSIALGYDFSCAVLTDSSVKCWGLNTSGQLGDGSNVSKLSPTVISGLSGVSKLALGTHFACALHTDQTVKCWGANTEGNLGDGTTVGKNVPTVISSLGSVLDVTAGDDHACAIVSAGNVKCWGSNKVSQLGVGALAKKPNPVAVDGLTGAQEIALGNGHTCAVQTDGTVKCWGSNTNGQLGDGTGVSRLNPMPVSGLTNVQKLGLGDSHSCALLTDQTVRCWGSNSYGQLGNGTTTSQNIPISIAGLTGVQSLAIASNHSCALLGDQTVKCWGQNSYGQLGEGTTTNRLSPTSVSALSGVVSVASYGEHTCGALGDGTVKCWGSNSYGQLGNGTTTNSSTPVTVTGLSAAQSVATSNQHSCALLTDQSVKCWGYGARGELGNGGTVASNAPVSVVGLSAVQELTVGFSHSCARTSDGSIKCWGYNYAGQLGDGSHTNRSTAFVVTGLNGATGLDAGQGHSCAVLSDGSVRCWGLNDRSQLGTEATLSRSLLPIDTI